MKWLRSKWNNFRKSGWKYAVAIVIGYALHLTIEGLIVNYAWYAFIKPTYLAVVA